MSRPRGPHRARFGFARRLLLAQALVLVAGALTTWMVASAIGPGLFHEHLQRAGVVRTSDESLHVEEAFSSALLLSLGGALAISVLAALLVSWYFSVRVQRSLAPVSEAAALIAEGKYVVRVPDPGLGGDFATLSHTVNELAARLEAVEGTRRRMLGDLAHELRTPIATIDAHLEALEDGVREPDEETLRILREATQRVRRLAEDIGAVSRVEEGGLDIARRRVDAAAVVRAAAELAAEHYQAKGVALVTETRAQGMVDVDPDRLGQVFTNLLDNALRHTPGGGRVTIACDQLDRWVQFSVTDTGFGIEAEHLPHVFDRFYRVDTARDRTHGGSGVGLSIARSLVEAQGGRISVSSEGLGQGSRFVVLLPLAPGRR